MWVKALALILLNLLISIFLATAERCYNTGNFTTNSTYGKNRDLILYSLPGNVSANGGFFNATIGQDSNKVYALGMCKGDLTSDECYGCLNASIHLLIAKCPNRKEAYAWSGKLCLARYANRSFFGTLELTPVEYGYSPTDINLNLTQFDTVWEKLTDSVVRKASTGSSMLKYATAEAGFTTFQTIYAQMQCSPDLSQNDCDTCLRQSVSYYERCCHGKQGGSFYMPNCFIRWELYPFYTSNSNTSAISVSPTPAPASPSAPKSVNSSNTKGRSSQILVIMVVPIIIVVAVLVILAIAVLLKRRKKTKQDDQNDKNHVESLQFDFNAIRVATGNFSDSNMLGRGGFGFVYKGELEDGHKVAIKRFSGNSGQGEQEFKNEVLLLAKLQHRNLVMLLGFSLEQKERILIYEFLPNSSLDNFIFDPVKRLLLNWEKRYKIIEGIAKGLLYLHQDSQYRIIHRDLKAANILLDAEMNPKISDFGMAKLFAGDQTQADTNRIVGTYGYMAPEYAWHGQYSFKSDVYGFGVLVLEIISGQKINSFCKQGVGDSLLTHAWKSWNEGTAIEFVDPILRDGSRSEIMRSIHFGLLCVQENIAYRPNMASVVLMLSSYSISLPLPSRPAFCIHSIEERETVPESSLSYQSKSRENAQVSVNEASISALDPR